MDWKITLAMIMIPLVIFGVLIGGAAFSEYYGCKTKATIQEMEYSWGYVQGCMVKVDNKWIDYDRLRYMND